MAADVAYRMRGEVTGVRRAPTTSSGRVVVDVVCMADEEGEDPVYVRGFRWGLADEPRIGDSVMVVLSATGEPTT